MPADGILAARSRARISASPASRAATQNLADFTDTIYPQSEARHDPGIHGRGPRWVIRVVPAIPACPARPKSGHSANARVYEYTPPRSRRGARRIRRRHRANDLNVTAEQWPPRGAALRFNVLIGNAG